MTGTHCSSSLLARLRRQGVDGLREIGAHAICRPRSGQGPLAVFMPAGPVSDGAVRLRIHAPARALREMGWHTTVLPWKLGVIGRQRIIARLSPDILVIQGVRHPANRPHLYPGRHVLLDVDDADFHLPHLAAPMETALASVAGVVAGSAYIARWAQERGVAAHVIWTGTIPSHRPPDAMPARPPVVAWAQTRPMTYLREAEMVRAAIAQVADRHPGTTLRLYDRQAGDDPGFADSFRTPGLTVEWRATSGYARYLRSFDDVAVGLAPLAPETPFSRGKSFGKVLAYLDRGAAVVASDAGEHGAIFDGRNGRLVRGPVEMAEATLDFLRNPVLQRRTAEAGRATLQSQLSVQASARRMVTVLDTTLARPIRPPECPVEYRSATVTA